MKKDLFVIHLVVTSLLLVVSVYWMAQDVFSIGKYSIGNIFFFTCPACFVIPLGLLSLGYLQTRPLPNIYYSPMIISAATIIIGILLFSFENAQPDFAFIRHFPSYEHVVSLIDKNEIAIDQDGIASLPDEYKEIFYSGLVYVPIRSDEEIIYFEDGSDSFDLISWGYVYSSNGNPPIDECSSWRNIVPPMPNWFYCDAHRWVGFSE